MQLVGIDQKKLETLIDINTSINSNYNDGRELLTQIIESATRLSEGEASSLILVNQENHRLYFEIATGIKGYAVKQFSLDMGEGIAGWVVQHNKSLIVNEVETDSRFKSDIGKKIGFSTRNILAVPMHIKNRCVGVLEIINKKDNKKFTEEDLEWLEIFATQAAIAIQNAETYEKIREEVINLQEQIKVDKGYHTFIKKSKLIEEKLQLAYKAAETNSSVLLLGESGVGKELFAEQIHLKSLRKDKPFVRVNCAALPGNLLESELFGHMKGSFTSAINDRIGRFELANGGTIFLDEIGDFPLALQIKLLRVIQSKTFERVGSNDSIEVDVRIIAATNKDIEKEVKEKRFRADLYYRLNVLPIYIPALRDRKEDIPVLANFFLSKFKYDMKKQIKGFTSESMEFLLSYSWPGNVRELENAIERSVVITQDEYIQPDTFCLNTKINTDEEYCNNDLKGAINLFKKHFIVKALNENDWKQTETAKRLGIQRTYLSRLLKELDIRKK